MFFEAILSRRLISVLSGLGMAAIISACAEVPVEGEEAPETVTQAVQTLPGYEAMWDNDINLPAVPLQYLEGVNQRVLVYYETDLAPGTIEVDPFAKFLYLINDDGTAMRYPIAVGREGRGLRRATTVGLKREWPSWQPTANMLRTEPEVYGGFARGIPGGKASPLGARALYLFSGGRDTRFRIHGTNDLQSIGNSGSAGCIRMFNQDVIHLYEQVQIGARVVIRSEEDSMRIEEEHFNRGIELPAFTIDPEIVYAAVEQELAEREARRAEREAAEAAEAEAEAS